MGTDEVRHQIRLLARPTAGLGEPPFELLEHLETRLAHLSEHVRAIVFRGHLQMPADEIAHEQIEVVPALQRQVVTDAGRHKDVRAFAPLTSLGPPHECLHHLQHRAVIEARLLARGREQAAGPPAGLGLRAGHAIHVRGRAADVLDRAAKILVMPPNAFGLFQQRRQ